MNPRVVGEKPITSDRLLSSYVTEVGDGWEGDWFVMCDI